jgi:signal transduction histidine kinase
MSVPEGSLETSRRDRDRPLPPPVGFDPFELSRLRGELRLMKFLGDLSGRLAGTRDAESALRFIVRACKEYFEASAACLTVTEPPHDRASLLFSIPQQHVWDLPMFAGVTRGEKPPVHPNLLFARIRRRDRGWGVLALYRSNVEFDKSERQALVKIGVTVSALLRDFDVQRIDEVRDRIDRKIMEELRPIDLSYQILDALRSLTRYDHSGAVLMNDGTNTALELVAEQIAWRKGKSARIGSSLGLTPQILEWLSSHVVYGFTRTRDGAWREWDGRPMQPLADLLDYNRDGRDQPEQEMLVAPLRGRDGVLGLLKVSACHPETFGAFESDLLSSFLPQAAIAVHNAQRTESLETKMLAAERKHAIADVARGVSHDLNNALGAVLPLVEQMRADADSGTLDPKTFGDDLKQIEHSLQVCRRIFSGMLTFARRAAGSIGHGQVRQAIDCTLAILGDNLRRRGVAIDVDLPDELPSVAAGQSALEQVLINLVTNARDAMPDGGALHIRAAPLKDGPRLRMVVEDTGVGIAAEHLPLVLEPFFTTKSGGSGLGLSICRSIVWEMGGEIAFDSAPGRGTRVTLLLPTT